MTETYAHLSNNAVYSATIVFTLALICHMVEWAAARQLTAPATRTEQRALVAASAGCDGSVAAGAAGAAPARSPPPAAAGG